MKAERRAAIAAAALATLTVNIKGGGCLTKVDYRIMHAVADHDRRRSAPPARAVTTLGSTPLGYLLLLVSITAQARSRQAGNNRWSPILTAATAHATRWMLAGLVDRPRPPRHDWLVHADGPSFPSRHTSTAAVVAGLATGGVDHARAPSRRVANGAVLTVAASRIWLGVHWPTDVLAGWLHAQVWLSTADMVMSVKSDRATRRSPER